jgi:hypothetical protein
MIAWVIAAHHGHIMILQSRVHARALRAYACTAVGAGRRASAVAILGCLAALELSMDDVLLYPLEEIVPRSLTCVSHRSHTSTNANLAKTSKLGPSWHQAPRKSALGSGSLSSLGQRVD